MTENVVVVGLYLTDSREDIDEFEPNQTFHWSTVGPPLPLVGEQVWRWEPGHPRHNTTYRVVRRIFCYAEEERRTTLGIDLWCEPSPEQA
jgi:hypothetical protein